MGGADGARAFRDQCRAVGRQLRSLPAEVRTQVRKDGQRLLADPLATRMRGNVTGPWAVKIRAHGIRTTAGSEPTIKLGGARKVFSGGAAPRDVIPGTEFGGGRRPTTRQFRTPRPFVYATLADDREQLLADWARLVDQAVAATGIED